MSSLFFSEIRLTIFFFQAEDGIRDKLVTGVQTCALPISAGRIRYCPLGMAADLCGCNSRDRSDQDRNLASRVEPGISAYRCRAGRFGNSLRRLGRTQGLAFAGVRESRCALRRVFSLARRTLSRGLVLTQLSLAKPCPHPESGRRAR